MSKRSIETERIMPGLCTRMGVDKPVMCEKTRKLLKSKTTVGWLAQINPGMDEDYIYYYQEEDFNNILSWLNNYYFSSDEGDFEENITVLWESGMMGVLFQRTMKKVQAFRKQGEIYTELISRHYLDDNQMTELEIMEYLKISRSTYYMRLNEAIILFGAIFIGEVAALFDEDEERIFEKEGNEDKFT